MYVSSVVRANLVARVDAFDIEGNDIQQINEKMLDEMNFNWNPSRDYFSDEGHPSREPFHSAWNYFRDFGGEFSDINVQRHYRRIQIANQFHRCCFTCFKYCFKHLEVCRFGFPWVSSGCIFEPIIVKDRDKKSRIRIQVLPERNNANLNGTIFCPLLSIAHGGNHDVQYIGNSVGAAEYVASYASKAEEPDKKIMAKIYAKKIAYIVDSGSFVSDRQRLYSVGSAILSSSPVGSIQACYTLLGLKVVKSSRVVINLNPLHRKLYYNCKNMASKKYSIYSNRYFFIKYLLILGDCLNQGLKTRDIVINQLEDTDTAIVSGLNSALGKRRAYGLLMCQQRETNDGLCNITFFSLLTSYSLSQAKIKVFPSPPLLELDSEGIIILKSSTKKFMVDEIVFTRTKKDCVINLCPHIPVNDNDERSCYSTLLLHTPWPIEGEQSILRSFSSAIECLRALEIRNEIPEYVQYTLQLSHNSELIRDNVGVKESNNGVESDEHEQNISSDEDSLCFNENDDGLEDEHVSSIAPIEKNNNIGIITNVSINNKEYYKSYITNQQKLHLHNISAENSVTSENGVQFDSVSVNMHVKAYNYDKRNEILKTNVKKLTKQQLKAYNTAVEYISGEKGKQMLMFVTGEGGTGKSFLISLIMEYTQLCHGKQGGIYGSAVAVAPTGAAANVIKGYTWQSVYGKGKFSSSNKKKCNKKDKKTPTMPSITAKAVGAKLLGVKLVVLDEISMINLETLYDISERQKIAMGTQTCDVNERNLIYTKHFGGVHVLFTGDFYQLKPIGGEAIYTKVIKNNISLKGKKI